MKGSHAARACPAGVEDCEREGIEEVMVLWQGVKWLCIGQCVVCIVSTNERLWYFGQAFAGKGKEGIKKESNNSASALFIAISALRSVAATVAVALAASLFVVTANWRNS